VYCTNLKLIFKKFSLSNKMNIRYLLACLTTCSQAAAFSSSPLFRQHTSGLRSTTVQNKGRVLLFGRIATNDRKDQKLTNLHLSTNGNDDEEKKRAAIDVTTSKVQSDANANSQNILNEIAPIVTKIKDNLLSGDFGSRGEAYFAAQVVLILCILYGSIPLLGDLVTFLLGPCTILVGIVVTALGIRDLGTNLSPWPKVPENTQLVTDGLYGELRHPIYAGLLCCCLGISMWTGSAMRVLLTVVLWQLLERKCDYEETTLVKKFRGYRNYTAKVSGKFVPEKILSAMSPFTDGKNSSWGG